MRTRFLLGLDVTMFALLCVLESLGLTGLDLHEWLGFVLCPLVLLHVVFQWNWVVVQFRRLTAPGAHRARTNYLLNLLLLILMAAVLVSGVLISNQLAPLVGESLGRPRIWNEIHGWLNFSLVVAVGLHLALNWDWILGSFRRRGRAGTGLAVAPVLGESMPIVRRGRWTNFLWRGVVVSVAASLAALAVYVAMAGMIRPNEAELRDLKQRKSAAYREGGFRNQEPRRGRPASLPNGVQELAVTVSVVGVVIIIGRYVLRVHL